MVSSKSPTVANLIKQIYTKTGLGAKISVEISKNFNYTYNEIPDAICDIQNLKKLSFINFESDNLPNCICDLKDLKKLFISTKEKANYTIRKQVFEFKNCLPECEIKLVTK